ncbi:reverse transcriptase domain-containing protein [Pararhizobium mangrovi]|uniref:reverse transcriptase domain-containing protein n=1 Tax=Pararhizobium mangrovi TaxID=2590452 RepID=UPI0015E856D5|nr:reverse transcriptase domain-containing protein [Pararhizobium mangrovi]
MDEVSLAELVGVTPSLIFSILIRKDKHYRSFCLPKANGSTRIINSPRTYLKVIHWFILDNILSKVKNNDCVTAFISGRGPYFNAQMHSGAHHIFQTDLEEFFPSIKVQNVYRMWLSIGYNQEVAEQLSNLVTYRGELPQGAPTSPAISNIVAGNLDKRLLKLAYEYGYKYTRYADDITFSSKERIPLEFADAVNEQIVLGGFIESRRKRRFKGFGAAMNVTGLNINDFPQPPREWRKRTRALFHRAKLDAAFAKENRGKIAGSLGVLHAAGLPSQHPLILNGKEALLNSKNY